MKAILRRYTSADAPVLQALLGDLAPVPPASEDVALHWWCTVAIQAEGPVVGYSSLSPELHGQPQKPGRLFLHVAVAPDQRRSGVGDMLSIAALTEARQRGAQELACGVAADDEASLAFAVRRGFTREYMMLYGELDLARFDWAPWAGALDAAATGRIRYSSLAAAPDADRVIRAIYDLDRQVSADVPEWNGQMASFEQYRQSLLGTDPRAVIIALDGEEIVGFATTSVEDGGTTGYTDFLGVAPACRGQSIALTLKLLTIRWAQQMGLTRLNTHNNAASVSIVGLNCKLGYDMRPDTVYLTRKTTPHMANGWQSTSM